MKNITILFCALLTSICTSQAAPTEINYQGRLTDEDGNPASGTKIFSLKVFDVASGGNEIYSEAIGPVILDLNGVYSFQFGANGQSVIQVTDIIASANGVSTQFSKNLEGTPLDSTLVVADGNISWNSSEGSFGATATATAQIFNGFVVGINLTNQGEGYLEPPVVTIEGDGVGASALAVVENGIITSINVVSAGTSYTSATVTIAAPPLPYIVSYENNRVEITYDAPPPVGTRIVATYQDNFNSIVGALSAINTHWLELAVDGIAQSPRQKILSVPFAKFATNSITKEVTVRIQGPWFVPDYQSQNFSYIPKNYTVQYYITPNPSYKKIIGISINLTSTYPYLQLWREDSSSSELICTLSAETSSTGGNIEYLVPVILDWENYSYYLRARGSDETPKDLKITFEYSE